MLNFIISLMFGTVNTFYAALLVSKCWEWFAYHVPFLKGFELNYWQALSLLLVLLPFQVFYQKLPTLKEAEELNTLEHTFITGLGKIFTITIAFALAFVYNLFING